MQPPQKLQKSGTQAASKQPVLFTGKALPEINEPSFTAQNSETLSADNTGLSLDTSSPAANSVPVTSNPQAPTTSNPQPSASVTTGTKSYSRSNKSSDLPLIKVDVPRTLSKITNGL